MESFGQVLAREYTQRQEDDAAIRQVEAYAADIADKLIEYVAAVGDRHADGGWSWS